MPEFVLNRNYMFATGQGHVLEFKKGEPTYVPPGCVNGAVALGAVCVDGPVDVLGEEKKPELLMSSDDRAANIVTAFKMLEERTGQAGYREDFTAAGRPGKKAVTELLGFPIDAKELAVAWDDYLAAKGSVE